MVNLGTGNDNKKKHGSHQRHAFAKYVRFLHARALCRNGIVLSPSRLLVPSQAFHHSLSECFNSLFYGILVNASTAFFKLPHKVAIKFKQIA